MRSKKNRSFKLKVIGFHTRFPRFDSWFIAVWGMVVSELLSHVFNEIKGNTFSGFSDCLALFIVIVYFLYLMFWSKDVLNLKNNKNEAQDFQGVERAYYNATAKAIGKAKTQQERTEMLAGARSVHLTSMSNNTVTQSNKIGWIDGHDGVNRDE